MSSTVILPPTKRSDPITPAPSRVTTTPPSVSAPTVTSPTATRKPEGAKPSRRGRKTDAARIESRLAAELAERKLAQERKRAQPYDPLTKAWLGVALSVAAIIFVTSALFSFATVADVAGKWMIPAWEWLAWVVPGFLEAFIIYFGLDAIMNQAKGRRKDARSALAWMFVFASVAVVANSAHTIDGWGDAFSMTNWQAWIGVLMSALAPLSVVLITKRVSKLVFVDPEQSLS